MRTKPFTIVASLAALVAIACLAWIGGSRLRTPASDGDGKSAGSASTGRPGRFARARDLATGPAPALDSKARERAAQAVRQMLATSPGRLSSTAALPPFDREAFARNPQGYLSRVEPARCFQTAAPGPDAVLLETVVPARAAVTRGSDHSLWVKTAPSAPVTFTAFDGGAFKENGLPTVTVQADGRGLAVARFTAPAGVDGDVHIVAGSPMAAGVQRFFLRVVDTPKAAIAADAP
jgi:hypothetical protein